MQSKNEVTCSTVIDRRDLQRRFAALANLDRECDEKLVEHYTDSFFEAIRTILLEEGKLLFNGMFTITLKDIPGGTKPVFNPRTGTYNVRKPHKQLNITPDGDKLLIGGDCNG